VMTTVTAPGKIILCGEYAVLDGASAICMAVNRRARAKVCAVNADFHTVRTSGHVDGEWRFRVDKNGSFKWFRRAPPADGLELLQQIWKTINIKGEFDIELNTEAFLDPDSQLKLGLGSSAALTIALITALFNVLGTPLDAVSEAVKMHRLFQHGRGSGVDIAASFNGGIIEYRMQESAVCRSLKWPAGLEYAVLWSGQPVSTREKLKKLDEGRRNGRPAASLTCLHDAAEATAMTWTTGSTAELLNEFSCYIDVLKQFDVDHDLGIFNSGHRKLVDLATKQNVVYKPCGAGGGDAGIVLSTDRQALENFTRCAETNGFQLLNVSLENRGVLLES
jgi:phosphomevalonate kinase